GSTGGAGIHLISAGASATAPASAAGACAAAVVARRPSENARIETQCNFMFITLSSIRNATRHHGMRSIVPIVRRRSLARETPFHGSLRHAGCGARSTLQHRLPAILRLQPPILRLRAEITQGPAGALQSERCEFTPCLVVVRDRIG